MSWVVVGRMSKRAGRPYASIMEVDVTELPPGCAAFNSRGEAAAHHRRKADASPLWLEARTRHAPRCDTIITVEKNDMKHTYTVASVHTPASTALSPVVNERVEAYDIDDAARQAVDAHYRDRNQEHPQPSSLEVRDTDDLLLAIVNVRPHVSVTWSVDPR